MIHFVGFKDGQRYQNAVAVFGLPDFLHPGWDLRAKREIADEDIVIFACGAHDQPARVKSYPDQDV